MDYLDFGDNIDYNKYNSLVYLLRKFKKLTSNLTLGAYKLESDYGTFNFSDGFVNVGNNWILENPVTVTSNDVLKNTFYTFNFVVIDVNTTGTVNRRIASVTEGTGETGTLELTIPQDLIGTDEVILPNFTLEVVFNEHEYYTPLPDVHVDLSVDKLYVAAGETVTVTGSVTDGSGSPLINVSLSLNVNGTNVSVTTDTMGVFSYSYTGTGRGWVVVSCNESSVTFYDGVVVATVTGNSITLGRGNTQWLLTTGDVIVDWGDGSTSTVNNPSTSLTHNYTDGEQSHDITFIGGVNKIGDYCFSGTTVKSIYIPSTVTSLGNACFDRCTGLTSIVIPDSVTNLGDACFRRCSNLTSVTIPSSVTSLGGACFQWCSSLTSVTIPEGVTGLGQDSFFGCSSLTSITIPDNVTSIGYRCFYSCTGLTTVTIPSSVTSLGNACFDDCRALIDYELYWTGDNIINYDSSKMLNNTNSIFTIPVGETTNYVAKNYPSSKLVERGTHTYSLTIASDKQSILTTESVTITGTLLMDSSPYTGQSIALYDGSTLIDTLATDSNGNYSKTISGLTAGTYTFKAVNTNAESSTITVTVTEPTPVHNYAIRLTGDSIIETGDSATVIATLTDNNVAVIGETLSYEIKHGQTTIDTGTDTTDSNGQISISYTGTGVGDVSVEVSYGTLLQETYEVEDCLKYYSLTDNTHESAFTIPNDVVSSYSSDGWNMSATNYSMVRLTDKLTNDCSVEFTLVDYNKLPNADSVLVYQYSNGETMPNQEIITSGDRDNFPLILGQRMNHNLIRGAKYKIEYTSSTIKVYENNILLASASNTVGFPTRFEWHMGSGGRYAVYKDLKVKAL